MQRRRATWTAGRRRQARSATIIAQTLTDAQTTQSRQNIYAAPLDAMAQFGLQINGNCDIDQANAGTAQAPASAAYILDQWIVGKSGTWTFSAQQNVDAPAGFRNSLKVAITAGNVSPTPSDLISIRHPFEGLRMARLQFGSAGAQPVSFAFWAKAHRPGQYSGALQNLPQDRSFPFPFTINAADTWEYKTVTVPGDVTGTWVKDNTLWGYLWFTMAAGSGRVGAPNAWQPGNFLAATGTLNGAQATTDTLQITGLIVLPGIELPSALRSPFTQRFFDQEMLSCQRYYESTYDGGVLPGTGSLPNNFVYLVLQLGTGTVSNTAQQGGTFSWKVPKRAGPTVTPYGAQSGVAGKVSDFVTGTDVNGFIGQAGTKGFRWLATPGSLSPTLSMGVHFVGDVRM
jgi:hypothetical protein